MVIMKLCKGEYKMKKGQWFMNEVTGEVTNIHREAVEWYRQGIDVSIWINGVVVCRWSH